MINYYLGRQPIFNPVLDVVGYEILFRPQATSQSSSGGSVLDGDRATSEVILNAFLEEGLEKLVGHQRAFINLTRSFLLADDKLPPPSGRLVLEILEDIEPDREVVEAVQLLKAKGYVLALDDFIYHEQFDPLVRLVDYIKIDLRAISRKEVENHVAHLRKYPIKLLAEKIEDQDEYDWCKSLGFDLFQGYFLCKPRLIKGRRLPSNRMNVLRMLAQLQDPDVDVAVIERLISEDVALSFRLLKYINSTAFATSNKINSLKHAIVYLGMREVKHWANIVALSGVDDNPVELMTIALVRARTCELLARAMDDGREPGTAFIVGLFSLLDAILGAPLEEVLEALPLAENVVDALQHDKGPYADLLHVARGHEQGNWSEVMPREMRSLPVSDIYLKAVSWADASNEVLSRSA